jgi:hypothetical protein
MGEIDGYSYEVVKVRLHQYTSAHQPRQGSDRSRGGLKG